MNGKKLKPLTSGVAPDGIVLVQMLDGTQGERTAAEWWEHRREWAMVGIVTCGKSKCKRLPGMLLMAQTYSKALDIANNNGGVFNGSCGSWTADFLEQQMNTYLQGFDKGGSKA